MDYLKKANEMADEFTEIRRRIHKNAEVGMNLPQTVKLVVDKLKEIGCKPQLIGESGVVTTIGTGEKVLLLRADMDALPMKEESGEEFACTTGNSHSCGHDIHATMLLAAAKMLKENEKDLKGTVKLVFQPGEEVFKGAKDIIKAGVLENPKVDAAFAIHTAPGALPQGIFMYNDNGTMMCSADTFKITVRGRGAHGSYPQNSVDPINIATHIVIALQEIIARETVPSNLCVLTIGSIHSGSMANSIPESAELMGSIRANSKEMREFILKRTEEIIDQTAKMFRGTASLEMISGTPPLVCNPEMTKKFVGYIKELDFKGKAPYPGLQANASEDFAEIADIVPSVYIMLSAGFGETGNVPTSHNPGVRFNEETIPVGAAILAHCATRWLEENSNL